MRIRTQFLIAMLLFGIILVVISASAVVTGEEVAKASQQEAIASSIVGGANELGYLSNDYLIYRESQQLSRWQSRFASFSIDIASLRGESPQEQTLIGNIQDDAQRMKDVFESLVSAIGSSPQNQSVALDPEFIQVSWSRMAVQNQGMVSDADRLSLLMHARADRLRETNMIVIFAMIGVFTGYFVINSSIFVRRTLKSIALLQAGAQVVGSGNLDFKIEEKQNDEIGDLSRAFNRMTTSLKEVTASKADLEKEIEKRKKAEAEIVHLASFPELNPNPVLELDAAGNVKYANPAARTSFPDLAAQGRKHPFVLAAINTIQAGETHVVNTDIAVGDSWYEQAASYVPEGQTFRLYGRDITVRKQAEEALHKAHGELETRVKERTAQLAESNEELAREISERIQAEKATAAERQRLFDVLEILPAYVVLLTPDHHVPFANRFFRERFGESHGKCCYEYLFGRTEPCETCETYTVMKTRATHHWEWTGPDGRDYDIYDYPFTDSDGSSLIMEMGIDITEREKARKALIELNETLERRVAERTAELEAANKELEAFAYSVSHDLRAPLRGMEGFSSALLEDYAEKLDDQGKQYLGYVRESSQQMAQLIDDLLKISRVTRQEMSLDAVNLSALAQTVVSDLRKREPERQVEFVIAPDLVCRGDARLLRLVLENLLGNAWKFTGKTASPRIRVGINQDEGPPVYFVRDNGVGFDMKYSDKLFQPFQRLHKSSEFAGTGIGLATVQRIISRHGGQVWAEARVGQGATFYFTIGWQRGMHG